MFTYNLDPVIFHIGPLGIRWYSLFYALGFIITYWFLKYARKQNAHKFSDTDLSDFIVYLIVGVVIGARLFETLIWYPSVYLKHPLEILYIWKGGLSFHGGLVGAIFATWLFCRKKSFPLVKMLDLLAIPGTFALALGRIGNFFNAEIVGTVTDVPWCVKFPRYEGCRHPSQIYGAIGRCITGIFLMLLWKKKQLKDGTLTAFFLFFIGLGRIVADFWREDTTYLGFSTGQWLSAIMVIVAIGIWVKQRQSITSNT